MRDLDFLEYIVKELVDYPDDVKITRAVDELGVLLSLEVNRLDMGKVIGRQGATAKAIRTILRTVGMRMNEHVNLKILEPASDGVERAREAFAPVAGEAHSAETVQ